MDIEAACKAEVEGLHAFVEQWLNGANDETSFTRFESVLAPTFRMVTPTGEMLDRAEVCRRVHASRPDQPPPGNAGRLRVWIQSFRFRFAIKGVSLIFYEEWQARQQTGEGRLVTAILKPKRDTPHGLEWLHVHETWLPANTTPGS